MAKVVFVGNSAVGKTALATRIATDVFNEFLVPNVQTEHLSASVSCDDKTFSVDLWDTAGQEKYAAMSKMFLRDSIIAIVVYDITVESSLDRIDDFVQSINELNTDQCAIFLLGNKEDLSDTQRKVSFSQGQEIAERINAAYFFEVSARTGLGITELKEYMARTISENEHRLNKDSGVDLRGEQGGKPQGCC